MDLSSSTAQGMKRALPLDLQDIATAIQNLPGDSSTLLPSPSPFVQSFRSTTTATSSGSFAYAATGAAAVQTAPMPATTKTPVAALAHSVKLQQAINRATHRANRRVRRDIGRGRYTTKQITDVLHGRNLLFQNWHKLNAEALGNGIGHGYRELDKVWSALHTNPPTFPHDISGTAIDNGSIQILTQSLANVRLGDSCQPRSFTACEPGTVLFWTKYFKGIVSAPDGHTNAESGLTMMPVQPMQALQPRRQRQLGEKRPMTEQLQSTPPAPKRRLLSRTVSLGHPAMQNDENEDGGVQFQPLPLTSRSSSAQEVPTAGHQEFGFQSPRPVATSIKFDLISSISSCLDIVLHVCKFLKLNDILVLYRVSRVFKATFDNDLEGNVLRMARQFASAETVSIFPWQFYMKATISLPSHTEDNGQSSQLPQRAPTLRYINMLVSRERKVRDIVATLARAGHRLPLPTATAALKKMWLLMDIPTNHDRVDMLQNETLFSDADLLTIQMFHVKLVLYFHDPLQGPDHSFADAAAIAAEMFPDPMAGAAPVGVPDGGGGGDQNDGNDNAAAAAAAFVLRQQQELPEHSLVETLLGQRSGFDVLWNLMRGKAFRTAREVMELKVRYDYTPPAATSHQHQTGGPVHSQFMPMDAIDHNAAQILSSMTTAEAAPISDPSGYNIAIPRSLEALLDLGIFDLDLDTPAAVGDAMDAHGQDGSSATTEHLGGENPPMAQPNVDHENNFVDFSTSLNFDADSSFGFDQPFTDAHLQQQQTDRPRRAALDDIIQTVPVWEMGIGHLEGWGQGTQHLLRPDELAPLEAARRMRAHPEEHMDLNSHVPYMGVWGNRDFNTGENLLPSLDELYISDDEDDKGVGHIDTDDEDNDNKENIEVSAGATGEGLRSDHAVLVALVSKEAAEDMYPVPELRLGDRCGNVAVHDDEWQPYQALKIRWDTLNLQERIDVWWENHQERLRRQAWTQRDGNDQRASSGNIANNINDASYNLPDGTTTENGENEDANDADGEEDYGIGSDVDEEMIDEDFDFGDEDEDEEYRSGSSEGSAFRNSQKPTIHGTSPPSTPPVATDPNTNVDANGEPSVPLPDTSQNLSRRHQGLVRSCIRWALREQDEVDAALLAQADMTYEEEELEHWDEFMAAAMAAGNPIFGDVAASGDISMDDGNVFGMGSDYDLPTTPIPNPEDVLAPEFGSLGDVLRLVHQVQEATAVVDKARDASRSDNTTLASMASMRLSGLVKEAEDLQSQLEAVLQGEVFAIEI